MLFLDHQEEEEEEGKKRKASLLVVQDSFRFVFRGTASFLLLIATSRKRLR